MTPHQHLESIDPGLVADWIERASIRIVLGGQNQDDAMRDAYRETCKRIGVKPCTGVEQLNLISGGS